MKVALLTNFIPPYRLSLYQEIAEIADDFRIFISTEMEKDRDWKINHGELKVILQKSISYTKSWKNDLKTIVHIPWDTFSQLKQSKAEVIISSEMGVRSLLASIYCKWYKRPLILWLTLSEYTETDKKGLRVLLRKFLLKRATAVLCNGKSGERYIRSLGFNNQIFHIPCSSDYKITAKTTVHPIKKILYAGRIIKRKGIKEFVNAMELLVKRNPDLKFDLVIAGNGSEENLLKNLRNKNQINLSLLGALKYNELKEIYKNADLFIFPTLADEWGVVVNEAFSSGLPVIGSKYSQAVEELVEEDKNGWIFDPLQVDEFVSKLKTALEIEDKKLIEMSKYANERIQNISPKIVAQKVKLAIDYAIANP